MAKRRRYRYFPPAAESYTPSESKQPARRDWGRRRVVAAIALVLAGWLLVGCWGVGGATAVGSHEFPDTRNMTGGTFEIMDPPLIGRFLGGDEPQGAIGQFSPDGRWLYLAFWGEGDTDVATISARSQAGVLQVALHTNGCTLVCAASANSGGTRMRLDPPVDLSHPATVEVNGASIDIEPWVP